MFVKQEIKPSLWIWFANFLNHHPGQIPATIFRRLVTPKRFFLCRGSLTKIAEKYRFRNWIIAICPDQQKWTSMDTYHLFWAAIWGQQATLRAQLAEVPRFNFELQNFESSLVKMLLKLYRNLKVLFDSLPQGEIYSLGFVWSSFCLIIVNIVMVGYVIPLWYSWFIT